MATLVDLIQCHGLQHHLYVITPKVISLSVVPSARSSRHIYSMACWSSQLGNFNEVCLKTEHLFFLPQACSSSNVSHLSIAMYSVACAKNLGFIFASLSLTFHLQSLSKPCGLHLQNISRSLTLYGFHTLVLSHLSYISFFLIIVLSIA